MRDILFKAKTINSGKWVEGHYYYDIQGEHIIVVSKHSPGSIHAQEPPSDYQERLKVDPETISQYTEKKDENGVRIFDGDTIEYTFITKESEETFKSEVFFDEFMWLTDEHSLNRICRIKITGNTFDT